MAQLTARQKFIQVALKYELLISGLPKTGQLSSYSLWDDGYYQAGKPKTGPRFTDNGDNTITDHATGLMWIKDPSQLGGVWGTPGNPDIMTWEGALLACYALGEVEFKLWRLPNVNELHSIVNYFLVNPAIATVYFPNAQADFYWSSTTSAQFLERAWIVDFHDGDVEKQDKATAYYARPVRGGL